MGGPGKGKGKGKGKGGSYWTGRGKGKGAGKGASPAEDDKDVPQEKTKPTFVKLKDVRPGTRSYDLIVQVGDVTSDSTRDERRRAGRTITVKCTEASVGDETGCILLTTRQQDKADVLTPGAHVALLNVKMRRVQESYWLDVDNWGAIKPLDQVTDLLPENFDTSFQMNKDVDRSKKIPPKPSFVDVEKLEPERKGVHIVCKVLDVKVEERSRMDGTVTKVAEATIGDKKGCVTLVARGPPIDVLQPGALVVIFNAHIEMFNKGFMRLVVDRWGDIKPLDAVKKDLLPDGHLTAEDPIEEKVNKSTIEWMLVDE